MSNHRNGTVVREGHGCYSSLTGFQRMRTQCFVENWSRRFWKWFFGI